MKWFELSAIGRKDWNSVESLFPYEWNYEFDWLCRRGIEVRRERMIFRWYGKNDKPWDLLGTSLEGVLLMSRKAETVFTAAGLRGLKTVPAEVRTNDERVLEFGVVITPMEYVARRFKKHKPLFDEYQTVCDAVVTGLDEALSDFWIGPMHENDQTFICSERVIAIAKQNKLTNFNFIPLSDVARDVKNYVNYMYDGRGLERD